MPDYLKTLPILLFLATATFAFAKSAACSVAQTSADYSRRRNLWLTVTVVVFLANSFWIYIVVVGAILLIATRKEPNKLALFFVLLFAVPPIPAEIGGLGIVNFLFVIDYLRLIALTVLLPAFLYLRKQKDTEPFGSNLADKLLAGYLLLQLGLILEVSTLTNAVRVGVFYPFLGIFLPYYVASRSMRTLSDFRGALTAFVLAALILSVVGLFEFVRHWLLYHPLENTLGINWKLSRYLARGDELRATASTGQPIPLGFAIAVAMGFYVYLKKSVADTRKWNFGMALLVGGLISSLSRGPWVGAAVMLLLFLVTNPRPMRRLIRVLLTGALVAPGILLSPAGDKVLSYLPWIGTVETSTIDFRAQLLEYSINVILRNPFFGAPDYINDVELQDLATGTGFIDIVNSYVGIGMAQGLVGLSLFLGVFLAVLLGVFKSMRRMPDKDSESYLLGQALFAVLVGILVTIGTVSSISIIPVVYWAVAGLGVAYVRMSKSREVLVTDNDHPRIGAGAARPQFQGAGRLDTA
ncbi:MAG: O-antigen ligase family protein [Sulfuritalea sp.]|nr:O-antigen ligase family protein [Sulfuritalea sp.]